MGLARRYVAASSADSIGEIRRERARLASPPRQAPAQNASIVGAFVYSHSGEFSAVARDLRIPGFALDLELVRSYRSSLAGRTAAFGRGWTCNLARRVERAGKDLVYHDGGGGLHRFVRGQDGVYDAPAGIYAVLRDADGVLVLEQRFGARTRFRRPEEGGEILAVEDRNGNELRFSYAEGLIEISDSAERRITVSVDGGLWRGIEDHAGRAWRFVYDPDDRLVEVRRPLTRDFPDGTFLGYAYDADHRLVALIDAKGQAYLVNRYDDDGRVVGQTHGNGEYVFEYDAGRRRTRCQLKNGGVIELDHDDAGHATQKTLQVRADALAPDDGGKWGSSVALVTECDYNTAGELIRRREPSGRETRWRYADTDGDPRNRGNLLEVAQLPRPGVPHEPIVRRFSYARDFQVVTASVDPRGHRTTFDYDARGNRVTTAYPPVTIQPVGEQRAKADPVERVQHVRCEYDEQGRLVRRTEIDGVVTDFAYHSDGCRLIARVVHDAAGVAVANEYDYDASGNCTEVRDGKGNAVRLAYNALGCLESAVSRAPFEYRVEYAYDENYDEIEAAQSFERLEIDRKNGKAEQRTSTMREQRAYDMLRNVVERRLVGGETVVRETCVRDEAGRLVRHVQPLGDVTEYRYDERDLVVEKRSAVGKPEGLVERYAYSLDGSPRTRTDGDGHTTAHLYDGFERYCGFRDAAGTTKRQSLDEAGNVVSVSVGDGKWSLLEARYRVDEWNRVFRIDRLWHDLQTGKPQGATGWDGADGLVSTVFEWGENGRPTAVWDESGNVVTYAYDGCSRLIEIADATGRSLAIAYDENGNVTELVSSGAEGRGRSRERYSYDAMDRLEVREVDDGPAERFRHNAFGAVVEYVGPSGVQVTLAHDALGRHVGHAYSAGEQAIVWAWTYDDDYRLTSYVDAAGNRTVYGYDGIDRQNRIVYPDGTVARVDYNARGNPVRVVDAKGDETSNQFDAVGRLVATTESSGREERFAYDGAGRLLSARAQKIVQRTYDSLSRVTTETDGRRRIELEHDAAGNLTTLVYPSGEEVRRTYDVRHRLTSLGRNGIAVATFDYGDDDRVSRIAYGDALEATFAYDEQQRLESIEYRSTADGRLVDGYRYGYDPAGRMTHEIQLARGDAYGERYAFDAAGRPVRADYGVADVFDTTSAFEHRTTYEYFAVGRWRRRVDLDGGGQVLSQSAATVDSRNRYRRFGKYVFAYDRNGNCVRKESANAGFCLYTYDDANRLVKVECYDARAQLVQTIEYFYDALGRQTRKLVTDAAGVSTETTYVWIGSLLAEEYENGTLVRTYVHGIGAMPVGLSSTKTGEDYTYLLNGRGLVTGIVGKDDPNAFAERYGYELTGTAFLTELAGVPVSLPERSTTFSGLDNPLVTGDQFGSVLSDWANGTLTSSGGGHYNADIAAALNSVSALGDHTSVKVQVGQQLQGLIGMLGLGGNASAPSSTGGDPGFTMNPDWKLYADGDDSDLTPPPLVSANDDGTTTVHNADGTSSTAGPPTDKPTAEPPSPTLTPTPKADDDPGGLKGTSPDAGTSGSLMDKAKEMLGKIPLDADVKPSTGQIVVKVKGTFYTDPDATGGVTLPSPGELETRFNRLKHPVNPNGGPMDDPVDTSSPPPARGGPNPTLILVDPDATTGDAGGSPKIDMAPIDHVPGWQPESYTGPRPTVGVGGDTAGRHWP